MQCPFSHLKSNSNFNHYTLDSLEKDKKTKQNKQKQITNKKTKTKNKTIKTHKNKQNKTNPASFGITLCRLATPSPEYDFFA